MNFEVNTHPQGVNADQIEDLWDCVAAVKEEGIWGFSGLVWSGKTLKLRNVAAADCVLLGTLAGLDYPHLSKHINTISWGTKYFKWTDNEEDNVI